MDMTSSHTILVVEENHKERSSLTDCLEAWGYHVTTAYDGTDAAQKIANSSFQLVIASFEAPGISSKELFFTSQRESNNNGARFLFQSRDASVEDAVEMVKAGALDFVIKPMDTEHLKLLINQAFGSNGTPENAMEQVPVTRSIITKNKDIQRLQDLAEQVADSKASVLIQGESGTGKEPFARFVHEKSRRRNGPLVAVNCGALPETLLESELFGHEKGAFTGALSKKPGKFELAHGGTILLDEITEMAFHLQSKLLRVLQEQTVDRVGGLAPISVDVRVVATTNREIREAIENEAFREDLYYRLNVIPIIIPPLRERPEDIPVLARFFIEKYNRIDRRHVKSLTNEALEILTRLPFKGNVRELENIIERAVLLCDGETICEKDLLLEDPPREKENHPPRHPENFAAVPLKEVEKKTIFRTLDETNGNRTHAAKILGISVRTLRNKLNEYKETLDTI
jgi:DNA-binding NtrC family response regulator